MTQDELDTRLKEIYAQGQRIEQMLGELIRGEARPVEKSYPLATFATFDWRSIGAEVVEVDTFGATLVRWRGNGQVYKRRNPSNKKRIAIWFSRYLGTSQMGAKQYERLVTFVEQTQPKRLNKHTLTLLTEENTQMRYIREGDIFKAKRPYDPEASRYDCFLSAHTGTYHTADMWVCDEAGDVHPMYISPVPVRTEVLGKRIGALNRDAC